ncbi:hypothetical protein BRE01_17460 [Brevibacillus reuszeri]|uniref:YcdB/YcdC repeated domain-containing protein n=1 Tax=Brevibacillus reuszeri TaxID=54915 RepID=A0A0K9Z091_9BACL|nr:YcdB/YcdC domain-containing protein [Brevibacillus reuszeri]KNB74364.1 hypothetical protein ADS79_01270 [Brevibacillus reuszeri]MED1856267.1 hypothetical protein [Brevibacillus reuszeri]GED68044.1 hypothetical protein BRE01_17460 [Brevibacillus reuszeri]
MKRNVQNAAMVLSVATILSGLPVAALAASPQALAQSSAATAATESIKLPAATQKMVAALEKLEPGLKALTDRQVESSETYIYLDWLDPKRNGDYAFFTFDLKTGNLVSYEAYLTSWRTAQKATDDTILKKVEQAVVEVWGADKRKTMGNPSLSAYEEEEAGDEMRELLIGSRTVFYPVLLNGLEIDGGNFGIGFSTDLAGHIEEINVREANLKDVKVPDVKTALTPEAVKKQYFNTAAFDLGYVQDGKDGKPGMHYVLRYAPIFDATSGKLVDEWLGTEIADDTKRKEANFKNITLKPQAKSLAVKGEADARKLAASMFGMDMKEDDWYLSQEQDDQSVTYSFSNDDSDSVSLTVDAATGLVTDANHWEQEVESKTVLSKEETLKKAISFIEPYAVSTSSNVQVEIYDPVKSAPLADWMKKIDKEMGVEEEEEPGHIYGFSFNELHKNTPILDRYYWVLVDSKNGKIVQFSTTLPMKDATFPEPKVAVTEPQAVESFVKNLPLKQSYIWPTYYGTKGPELKLIYTIDTSKGWPYVDAVDGTLNWDE